MTLDTNKWPIFSLLSTEFLSAIRQACVLGSSGNEAIVITTDDEVYALGSNCSGCLGLGLCLMQIIYFLYFVVLLVRALACGWID